MTVVPDEARAAPSGVTASAGRSAPVRPAPFAPLALLGVLLIGVSALALFVGTVRVAPDVVLRIVLARSLHVYIGDWPASAESIVWNIRLPRVLLAGLVGATLSMSGTAYQGVFRNPLAEPYLIGVAAGAGLGATAVLISPAGGSWHGLSLVTPAAFAGALLAAGLALGISRGAHAGAGPGLILAGVAIAALCNAVTSFLFLYNDTRIISVFAWLMGGFSAATWSRVWVLLGYAALCGLVLLAYGRLLNVLLLDEEQARHLGLDVDRVKLIVLGAASLAAAAAVSVSGLIGFVGLIVPHVVRMLVGPDHRRVLPCALLGGAAFMIGADLLARTALGKSEIPVGVITAFAGGPFFLYLLMRGRRPVW